MSPNRRAALKEVLFGILAWFGLIPVLRALPMDPDARGLIWFTAGLALLLLGGPFLIRRRPGKHKPVEKPE